MTLHEFLVEFDEVRKVVSKAITYEKCVMHEPGKYYEGEWEIRFDYPGWDEDSEGVAQPEWCVIVLHCYLIGPSRHYEWRGTLQDAITRCKKETEQWCKEVYENECDT